MSMNISQRLRTCAKHTGLDAVIELLQEAADEIDALQARAQVHPAQAEVTDEQIDSFLRDLNSIASDYDVYEYGLPNHCLIEDNDEGTGEKMREAVRAILALRPVQVPMTEDQVWHNDALMSANGIAGFKMDALMRIVRAAEAHHGITAQAKKETP